ncbi:MAG: DUF4153 domain-containing protein [Ignavibacteriales bacterium]|nr:DUF4153 domain-containing protein [Ignavibacteriales bacterium]
MKLPSITQAVADAQRTFIRFPFVVLDAIIGTACALVLIDYEGPPGPTFLFQVIFAAVLGFPLLTGVAITSEKWKWSKPVSLGAQLMGVVLVALYSMSVPQDLTGAPNIHVFRLVMLAMGLILFAFAVPYLRHQCELGYWNYCKTLLLRILTAYLYTVVLWAGLAIALAALDNLFGVNIPEKRYGELWVFINGIFTTWFFLAGVPEDLESLDAVTDYPKGLKIFSQYILFPLVLVYLVILYAYLGKILLAWDWPQGWVSKLILGFIATGMSALLLLHPIRERTENIWISTASRWFYVIIIPLIVMLFFAVSRRLSEYGITEGRYLAIATGVWLCAIVPYFILSKRKKILFIPTSMCVWAFAVSFGPWGMFAVSENSQVGRLQELLTRNHILVDGRVQSKHDSVTFEATKQISSIISYLSEMHGFDAIQSWFGESLKSDLVGKASAYKDPAHVAKLMGIEYVRVWQASSSGMMVFTADRDGSLAIDGYDHMLRAQHVFSGVPKKEPSEQGISYRIGQDLSKMTVTISRDAKIVDSLSIDLQPLVNKLLADYGKATTDRIPTEKMAIVAVGQTTKVKMFLSSVRVQRHGGESTVVSYDGDIAWAANKKP